MRSASEAPPKAPNFKLDMRPLKSKLECIGLMFEFTWVLADLQLNQHQGEHICHVQ